MGFLRSSLFGLSVLSMAFVSPVANASEIESNQDAVLACIETIGGETNWETCREIMFEPCANMSVGSTDHVACLKSEQTDWDAYFQDFLDLVNSKLTTTGAAVLADNVGQWYEYRQSRCNSVAEERAAIGFNPEAAGYGCVIAETAGIVSELNACLSGKSTSPYCTIKE